MVARSASIARGDRDGRPRTTSSSVRRGRRSTRSRARGPRPRGRGRRGRCRARRTARAMRAWPVSISSPPSSTTCPSGKWSRRLSMRPPMRFCASRIRTGHACLLQPLAGGEAGDARADDRRPRRRGRKRRAGRARRSRPAPLPPSPPPTTSGTRGAKWRPRASGPRPRTASGRCAACSGRGASSGAGRGKAGCVASRPPGGGTRLARTGPPDRAGQGASSGSRASGGRPQRLRHVLEVDAHPRPGGRAPAHGVDQHVRGLEVGGGLRVARLPALDAGQRVLLARGARDLEQRLRWRRAVPPAPRLALRRLHARRLAGLLRVVRRPRRVAQPLRLLARRQLQQRLQRARDGRRSRRGDRRSAAKRAGMVRSVKSSGRHCVQLVPGQRARRRARPASAAPSRRCTPCGPSRSGCSRGTRRAAPPSTTCWWRGSGALPLHLAGQGQRRAPHLVERPAAVEAHVHVDAARARRLGPAHQAEAVEHLAHHPRRRPAAAPTRRRARDRGPRAARRGDRGPPRARGAGAAPGSRGSPSRPGPRRRGAPPPPRCGRRESWRAATSIQSGRASGARFW